MSFVVINNGRRFEVSGYGTCSLLDLLTPDEHDALIAGEITAQRGTRVLTPGSYVSSGDTIHLWPVPQPFRREA